MNIIKTSTLGLLVLLGASTVAVAETADAASVKMQIELDGYTGVQNVLKSKTGWTADAMESGKSVKLTVDVQGGIAKN